MRTQHDNRIVVDLGKVQCAWFGYRNQDGAWRKLKPTQHTVHNVEFDPEELVLSIPQGSMTMMRYAVDNNLLDRWTPECWLKLTASSYLVYTRDKAVSIWKEWNRRQFKPKNK